MLGKSDVLGLGFVALLLVGVLVRWLLSRRWDDELFRACREGDLQAAQRAISRGRAGNLERLQIGGRSEWTPLLTAVVHNQLAIVTLLLAAGAKVEARDEEGRTPLILAAQKGLVDIVQALLAKGADPTAKSFEGWTPLIVACYAGQTEIVHILLARCGAADIKWRNKQGMNALAVAVGQHHQPGGRMKIVKMLLSNDAKVDSRTLNGWTPLIKAAYGGHDDVIQLLLVSGADINASTPAGFTALIAAAQNGWIDCVTLLLEKGASVNAKTSDGSTALVAACSGGYVEVVELLVEYGADVNVVYKNGSTVLMAATVRGHKDIAFFLLDKCGVDPNVVNHEGWTALLVAADRGRLGIATRLLTGSPAAAAANRKESWCCDVNHTSNNGWTCLMSACQHGFEDLVDLLLAHGADCNVAQMDGWSPLLIAASCGFERIVRKLVDRSAGGAGMGDGVGVKVGEGAVSYAPAFVDGFGSSVELRPKRPPQQQQQKQQQQQLEDKEHVPTPLVAACSFGFTSIVTYLLSKGADRKAVDALNRDCLAIAMALKQADLINALAEAGFGASGVDSVRLTWHLIKRVFATGREEGTATTSATTSVAAVSAASRVGAKGAKSD